MRINVRGGTAQGGAHLCETCSHAWTRKGQRFREEETFCTFAPEGEKVKFRVSECNQYRHKNEPSLYDMKEIAWAIRTSGGRTIGLVPPTKQSPEEKQEIENL